MALKDLKQPIRVRRGTDAQRILVTFALGELVWTTDTHLLYVGDGSTAGGIVFAVPSHTQAISTITGLQDALDAKAATSHSQAISTVTGLQDALDAKAATSHSQAISTITGLQDALNAKSATGHGHAISDVSGLSTALGNKADLVEGVIPSAQIPAIAITAYLGSVASQAAMLLLAGQQGDFAIRSDLGMVYVITGDDPADIADWTALAYPTSPVVSVNSQTGTVTLSYSDVGAAASGHNHDSAYAAASHSHAISAVTGLQDALDAKAAVASFVPYVTAVPSISGTTTQGQTLTAADGTWEDTFTVTATGYQWQRNDGTEGAWQNITSATAATYDLVEADVTYRVRVGVRKTNRFGDSAWAYSDQTEIIAAAPTTSYQMTSVTCSGGSGYQVNDIQTMIGGTFTVAAQARITEVGGAGEAIAAVVETPGVYSVPPETDDWSGPNGAWATVEATFEPIP